VQEPAPNNRFIGVEQAQSAAALIASPTWDDFLLWRVVAEQADRLPSGPMTALVIDDMALAKESTLLLDVERGIVAWIRPQTSLLAEAQDSDLA
jgi:hypothetical protein